MKTAPGFVAFTCARCGAIGVVGDGESLSERRDCVPDATGTDAAEPDAGLRDRRS